MLCLNPTPSFMVSCFSSFIVLITIYNHAFDYVIPHSISLPIGGEQGVSVPFCLSLGSVVVPGTK